MRAFRFVAALFLGMGMVLAAGSAWAGGENDRLSSSFSLQDTKCDAEATDPNSESAALIRLGDPDNSSFEVNGFVSGTGTAGDYIEIGYFTDLPSSASASDKSGKVAQSKYSGLCIVIESVDENGPRNFDNCEDSDDDALFVEKCSVKGSVNVNFEKVTLKGSASANCSGTDLFGILTQDQVTSIQAAFPKGNKCGVKLNVKDPGKKSSLSIKLNNKTESPS